MALHVLILPVASVLFTTISTSPKGRCWIYVRLTSSVRQCRTSVISSNCSIVIAGVVQAHVYIGYLNSALKQAPSGCVISSLVDVIVVHSSSACEAGVPCEACPSSRCSRTSARLIFEGSKKKIRRRHCRAPLARIIFKRRPPVSWAMFSFSVRGEGSVVSGSCL